MTQPETAENLLYHDQDDVQHTADQIVGISEDIRDKGLMNLTDIDVAEARRTLARLRQDLTDLIARYRLF